MNAVYPAQNPTVLSAVTFHQSGELEDEGPTLLQSHNNEADHQKMEGSVGAECSTDPAISREFANLLT